MGIKAMIGKALAGSRAERGLHQQEAADAAGVARQTVSRVELGHHATVETWERMSAAYGMTLTELLRRASAVEEPS